jgi:hypothetical protein
LETEAAFPSAGVDEKIVETWRPGHAPFTLQVSTERVRYLSDALRFLWIHT